jgi:hypothetical protein
MEAKRSLMKVRPFREYQRLRNALRLGRLDPSTGRALVGIGTLQAIATKETVWTGLPQSNVFLSAPTGCLEKTLNALNLVKFLSPTDDNT